MPPEPVLDRVFRPGRLAASGAALSVALATCPTTAGKAALAAVGAALCVLGGRKFSLPRALLTAAGIVAVNLLVPAGRVLARLGPFSVTETALLEGLEKAITFEGLMLVSKATIRPGLRIPGRFGGLLGRAFAVYGALGSLKPEKSGKGFMFDLDEALVSAYTEYNDASSPDVRPARGGRFSKSDVALILGCLAAFLPHITRWLGR